MMLVGLYCKSGKEKEGKDYLGWDWEGRKVNL